jgi:integrase
LAQIDNNHHRRRPGEDPIDWTVRTAQLQQHANQYWYIHFTELRPGAARKYRTAVVSTRTRDKTEAWHELKIWGQDYIKDMRAIQGQSGPPAPVPTFNAAIDRYLSDTKPRRLSDSQDRSMPRLRENLGPDPVDQIDAARLAAFHAWAKRRGFSQGSIRHWLELALTVLRHAAECKVISRDAVPRYALPAVPRQRIYALSAEDNTRLFDAAVAWGERGDTRISRRTCLFTCLALDSGQRREAILGLTWERVNLKPGQESIDFVDPHYQPRNKRRCPSLPMTDRLLRVMARAARNVGGTGLVFPRGLNRADFTALTTSVGLPRFTPHVARHTWATLALTRGVPLATVAYILADSIATVDRTYNHHTTAMARENLERYNRPASAPVSIQQDKEIPHGMAAE